jgi:hypothetical protein
METDPGFAPETCLALQLSQDDVRGGLLKGGKVQSSGYSAETFLSRQETVITKQLSSMSGCRATVISAGASSNNGDLARLGKLSRAHGQRLFYACPSSSPYSR